MEPSNENVTPAEGQAPPPPADRVQPAEGESIPLPPITTPPAAEDHRPLLGRLRFLDGLLLLAVLLFALVVACFRASNSDVFLHLAVGRLVASGQYNFAADPFTFTAVGTWVNHAWGYCLALYLAYQAGPPDGTVLIVLKALAVAAAAGLMYLAAKRPADRGWVPAIAVLLGVLVMSPRLILSPFVGSVLFLSGVLFLLARHEPGSRRVWLVPLVCVLWVNTDAWFLLGPLAVALYVIGEAIQGEKERVRELLPVLAGSVAACLVNPYHVWAFTALPPELVRTAAALELATDPLFRSWHLSVFERAYYNPGLGLSPAGLSYFPLVALALLSFGLTFPRWRYWRVLLFLAFLGLSLVNIRTIPFFAVVAAPIAALNFLDASERALGPDAYLLPAWRSWAVAGRVLTVVVALALSAVSVPGWLQAQPHLTRRFDLTVEVDEGLRAAARQVAAWRDAGGPLEPGQRWFNLGPEVLAYFAWFCPGEKFFVDHRLGLYDLRTAEDFRAVRRALQGEDQPRLKAGEAPPPPGWRAVLRKHRLRWLVFHGFNLDYYAPTLLRLNANPEEWVPCFLRGRTAVFVWRDPEEQSRPPEARLAADFDRQAFGPEPERFTEDTAGPRPGVRTLADRWFDGRSTPWETWTGLQHTLRFAALAQTDGYYRYKNATLGTAVIEWGTAAAAATAGLPGTSLVGSALGAISLRHGSIVTMQMFMGTLESGPAASPYLAIRAARQGLRYAPGDSRGWMTLAEAYRQAQSEGRERSRAGSLPHTEVIRRAQRAYALTEALRLSTSKEVQRQLHDQLIGLYAPSQDRGASPNPFQDLFVRHQADLLRLTADLQLAPPRRIAELEKQVRKQETELEGRRRKYVQRAAGRPAVEKARLARESGLSQEAINLLLEANTKELMAPTPQGVTGLYYLVDLLLRSGRLDEARALLRPSEDPTKAVNPLVMGTDPEVGLPAYGWFRAQIGAATGDHAAADEALRGLRAHVLETHRPAMLLRDTLSRAAQHAAAPQLVVSHPILSWQLQRAEMLSASAGTMQQAADLTTLRSWLALEDGRTGDAAKLASEAVASISVFAGRPLALLIADLTKKR